MKDDAPPLILRRTERGLEPRSRMARDILDKYPVHSDVEITIRKRRSSAQNALYWSGLQRFVEATDAYPTAQHAHEAVKMDLGYTTPVKSLRGEIRYVPDSSAFARMDAPAFARFFEAARKLVIETFGFDPWAEDKEEAA